MPMPVRLTMDSARANATSKNLSFPSDIGPHGMLIVFRDYKFADSRNSGASSFVNPSKGTENVGDTILLPLPKTLQDNYNINVQAQQLGIFGEGLANAIGDLNSAGNINEIGGALMKAISESTPSASEALNVVKDMFGAGQANNSDVASKLSFLGRRALNQLPGGIGKAVDSGLGSIVNPKSAIAFDGVNLKQHSFNWDFIPQSSSESDMLKNIFKTIKKNSLPSYIHMNSGATKEVFARALLKYPSLVDIFLIGVDPSHYIYYKTAMVAQVSLDYTSSGGHVIMAGGKPGSVTMNITFMETDIHTSEDYGGTSETRTDSPTTSATGAQ